MCKTTNRNDRERAKKMAQKIETSFKILDGNAAAAFNITNSHQCTLHIHCTKNVKKNLPKYNICQRKQQKKNSNPICDYAKKLKTNMRKALAGEQRDSQVHGKNAIAGNHSKPIRGRLNEKNFSTRTKVKR